MKKANNMHDPNPHHMIEAARGDRPVDLLIRNTRLVNVFTASIMETDFAVYDGHVVGFGPYEAMDTLDLQGRFVTPGFIDAHVHIESSLLGPAQFARAVLPFGTTAVVADPHEIANVLGAGGLDYMLRASRNLPLQIFFTLPSCVPASPLETSGHGLDAHALAPYMDHPRFVALAEMMDFSGVIQGRGAVRDKLALGRKARKPLNGHAPGVTGRALHAYLASGLSTDHECTTASEALEKLAAGMHILIREGTGAGNLDDLLPIITKETGRRMMWCTDDRSPCELTGQGHIDAMVRRAVAAGVDPITAIQMATLNPAEHYGLDAIGAIAPGRRADFLVLDDLEHFSVRQVYCSGKQVACDGQYVETVTPETAPEMATTMQVSDKKIHLKVNARAGHIRIIETVAGQITTRQRIVRAPIRDDQVVSDPERDLLKIAVVERHHDTGRTGLGFVRGFGFKQGAIGATVAHDAHNMVLIGARDDDMLTAAAALVQMGGGMVVVDNGTVTARLALPVAGLMSDQPFDTVCQAYARLLARVRDLGCPMADPFVTMSFMALSVVPELKITDQGLVDVKKFEIVPLFVD